MSFKSMIIFCTYFKDSSIVAVVQSIITLLATFTLICCHHSSLREEMSFAQEEADADPEDKKRPSQVGHHYSLRRKAIAPSWTAVTLISTAMLLFVVISPIHYCIQAKSDMEKYHVPFGNGADEKVDNKFQGLCYSDAPELAPIRTSLSDLYSFSIISILFKCLFVLMVHRNWRSELRKEKKIIIYVEGPAGSSNNIENEMGGEASLPVEEGDPKMITAASSSHQESVEGLEGRELLGAAGGPDENGRKGKIQPVSEKGKK